MTRNVNTKKNWKSFVTSVVSRCGAPSYSWAPVTAPAGNGLISSNRGYVKQPAQSLCSLQDSVRPGATQSNFASLIILVFLAPAFLIGGCASPPPPLSDFEQSLYRDEPQKASVVIYRSTEESRIHEPISADIYIDKHPFVGLKGREYVQIYLSEGQHEIKVEYLRPCAQTQEVKKTIILEPEHVLYLEIVPSWGVMTWIYCSPFQIVPFPFITERIELFLREAGDARKNMGKAIDKELLKTRRIHR